MTVADVLALLAAVPVAADDAGRVDQLRALEDVKSLAGARQADIAVVVDVSQRRAQAAAGVPVGGQGAGVGAQIAELAADTGTFDGAGDRAVISAVPGG